MAGETAAAAPGPGSRGNWISYSYMATWAFLLYGLGNATPYLRTDLHLTEFETGLHGSALAIGTFGAGAGVDLLSRRLGSGRLLDLGILLLAAGTGLIVLAPSLPFSLAGALVMGLGGATIGTNVNILLSRSEEAKTRRLMGQANALAMIAAAAAPLAMGLAASGLHAWRVALLLPVAAFPVLTAIRPRRPEARGPVRVPGARVPRAYWFTWLLLLLGVAIEFSFVFWGSTIVARRTGISSADATLLASFFVLGMFLSRLAIGRGLGSGRAPLRVVAAGLVVALVGSSLVWVSTSPIFSLGFSLLCDSD